MRMTEQKKPTISIITATYNAAAVLPRLIESLMAQTDQDFEWVVADGGSADGTLALLENARLHLRNVVIDSRPDFGIYDALNRAIKLSDGDYYLVLGADDELFPSAIEDYRRIARESGADLVSAKVQVQGGIYQSRGRRWEWLYGMSAHVSGHAVGVIIRKALHERFGFYSKKYSIAADHHFILSAVRGGSSVISGDFVAGDYKLTGMSGENFVRSAAEVLCVQVEVGRSFLIQLMLFYVRVMKNSWRNRSI